MSSLPNERSVQRESDIFEAELNVSLGQQTSYIIRNDGIFTFPLYILFLFNIIKYIMMYKH